MGVIVLARGGLGKPKGWRSLFKSARQRCWPHASPPTPAARPSPPRYTQPAHLPASFPCLYTYLGRTCSVLASPLPFLLLCVSAPAAQVHEGFISIVLSVKVVEGVVIQVGRGWLLEEGTPCAVHGRKGRGLVP